MGMEGKEIYANALRSDFLRAFPDMRHVDVESAYGGNPVASVWFDDSDESCPKFTIAIAMTGVGERDCSADALSVSFENGDVVVSYSPKRVFPFGKTLFSKIRTGGFKRTYPLPKRLDVKTAQVWLADGLLTISLDSKSSFDGKYIPAINVVASPYEEPKVFMCGVNVGDFDGPSPETIEAMTVDSESEEANGE